MEGNDRFTTRNGDVAAKVIDGEAILINLTTGMYYSMGDVGGTVWSLIENNSSVNEIADIVTAHYDVDHGRARADVEALVTELLEENLVVVSRSGDEKNSNNVPASGEATRRYARPSLRKFGDMAEMFALDPPLPGLAQSDKVTSA
jgi:hypothetical protein